MEEKIIMDSKTMSRTIARLSHEIIERNAARDSICILGIMRRGIPLAHLLKDNIEQFSDIKVEIGELDITGFRDDLGDKKPETDRSSISFDINQKVVILADDVIFTGRTTRAAMDALMRLGRPDIIQLAVMVDRGHRELPVCANYVGKNLPTAKDEFVTVRFDELDNVSEVVLSKM